MGDHSGGVGDQGDSGIAADGEDPGKWLARPNFSIGQLNTGKRSSALKLIPQVGQVNGAGGGGGINGK